MGNRSSIWAHVLFPWLLIEPMTALKGVSKLGGGDDGGTILLFISTTQKLKLIKI